MSIRERVFKKIAEVDKVELETQKIELGLIDTGRTLIKAITEEEMEFIKIAKKIDSLKKDAERKVNILRNLTGNLKDVSVKIKKSEDVLGEGKMGNKFIDYQKNAERNIKKTISKYNI